MRHKLFRRLWIACAVGLFLAGWLILIATAHAQQQKPSQKYLKFPSQPIWASWSVG